MEGLYTNPSFDYLSRAYILFNEPKCQEMLQLISEKLKKSSFQYCAGCHCISETRTGNNLHQNCEYVYNSKHFKGN